MPTTDTPGEVEEFAVDLDPDHMSLLEPIAGSKHVITTMVSDQHAVADEDL